MASGWRREALAAALAGVAFAVWQFAAGWPIEGQGLASLGLDAERSRLAVGLAAALLAGGAASLARGGWLAWPLGTGWFCLFYLVPAVLRGLPPTPHGEMIDGLGSVTAAVAQVGLALVLSGIGAAAGRGVRSALVALPAAALRPDPHRLPLAAGLAPLVALSVVGLWAAPGLVLYGSWDGSYRPSADLSTRQVGLRYHSVVLGADEEAIVMLPPGYSASAASRYPVLYLLHGARPGTDDAAPLSSRGA